MPLLHVVGHAPAWLALEVSLDGQLRANQAGTLEMQIVNPNPFPVRVGQITLDTNHDPVAPFQLAALEQLTLTVSVAAPHTNAATLPVAWTLTSTSQLDTIPSMGRQMCRFAACRQLIQVLMICLFRIRQ